MLSACCVHVCMCVFGIAVFGSSIVINSGGFLPAIIFLSGVALLVLEIFIPGFGISGILGIVCLMGSFFLVLGGGVEAIRWLLLSLTLAFVSIYLLGKYIPNTGLYSRLILKEGSARGGEILLKHPLQKLVNQVGVATTLMRPAGKVEIAGQQYDALTNGEFLEIGQKIIVVKIQGNQIYVIKQ